MQKIHFIGIGGIGVSALAQYYLAKGFQVSGSDLTDSEIINQLQRQGAKVFIGHKAENISKDVSKVVYSAAARSSNPELKRAKKLKLSTLNYAQTLGELTKEHITLAVSGSHGKSTTTALLSLMLIKAGLDPTVIIGTRLKEFGGKNFYLGKSRYLLIEADEWNNSFHNYHPAIAVVTNIDKEHLDTFKNLSGVISGFSKYLKNIAPEGKIIVNAKDKNSLRAVKNCEAEIIYFNNSTLNKWPLKVPGIFNQLNAEVAWQAAKLLGVGRAVASKAVKNYRGSWRRLEPLSVIPDLVRNPDSRFHGNDFKPPLFYSDYAHHPNEIKATAAALKEKFSGKRLVVIFQPHQVERLSNLFNDFKQCFKDFDFIGILPAYEVAGRELKGGKTSKDLVNALQKNKEARFLKDFAQSFEIINDLKNAVVVFMGAGDIDKEVRKYFKSKLDFN